MYIQRTDDPAALYARVESALLNYEAENCFFLGYLPTLPSHSETVLLEFIDSAGRSVGVSLMAPGRHMVASRLPPVAGAALADFCDRQCVKMPGLQGPPAFVEAFASDWTSRRRCVTRVGVRMAIHQLHAVRRPDALAEGIMRNATPDDLDLLTGWICDFGKEIGEAHFDNARPIAERRVSEGSMRIWEINGLPVGMAGAAGATRHGIRINLVFTPPRHRRRGYATALVTALSQEQLNSGRRFCFLYTDLANPTSNKIYKSIGFERIADSIRIDFDASPGSARLRADG